MEDDDLSNIFEEAEKYLKKALRKWQSHLPELCEDAYQEAMIQVWRDVENGVSPKLKILRRAKQKAETFFHRNGEYFFGKPVKSRDGIRRDSTILEKVQVYLEEILPVTNTFPTPKQTSEALGITDHAAGNALRAIKQGRIDHMKYRDDGRMDWDYYKTFSVEQLKTHNPEGKSQDWADNPQVARFTHTFEHDIVSHMDLMSLLNQLPKSTKEVLYLMLFEGYTCGDIGRYRGYTNNISTKGDRLVKAAINQARMVLDPYFGECSSGHLRTPDSCLVKKNVDGFYTRTCLICAKEKAQKTLEKKRASKKPGAKGGRPRKLYCPKNHKKVEESGRMVCRVCKVESNKRRRQANLEKSRARERAYYEANKERLRDQKNRSYRKIRDQKKNEST